MFLSVFRYSVTVYLLNILGCTCEYEITFKWDLNVNHDRHVKNAHPTYKIPSHVTDIMNIKLTLHCVKARYGIHVRMRRAR